MALSFVRRSDDHSHSCAGLDGSDGGALLDIEGDDDVPDATRFDGEASFAARWDVGPRNPVGLTVRLRSIDRDTDVLHGDGLSETVVEHGNEVCPTAVVGAGVHLVEPAKVRQPSSSHAGDTRPLGDLGRERRGELARAAHRAHAGARRKRLHTANRRYRRRARRDENNGPYAPHASM
jgi:hypothetical protein